MRRSGNKRVGLFRSVTIVLTAAAVFGGCGESGRVDRALTGKTLSYAPGHPSFDLECVPVAVRGESELLVYLQIRGTSLTFVRAGSGFEARITLLVRLIDPETGDLFHEHAWDDTVAVPTYSATQSDRPIRVQKSFAVPPGRYVVEALLEDRSTGKDVRRGQPVAIPEAIAGRPLVGSLILSRLNAGVPEPVIAFHVPRTRDSLLAAAPLFNVPPGSVYDYDFTLRRFVVDTAAAAPPYYFSAPTNTMEGRRFYPEAADTVVRVQATESYAPDQSDFRLLLPPLEAGMYQMVLRIWGRGQTHAADSGGFSRNFFAVMGPLFPRPALLDELVAAAVYIAGRDEWAVMDTAGTPEEKLRAFDTFWLSLGRTPQQASALLRRYYTRVEEANRLFSTFKEGWKTDRGMVYIILGPPERVERLFDQETWYFNHPGTYAENTWKFRRVYFAPDNLSMEDFLLARGRQYEYLWQRILMKWREGEAF